MLNSILGNTVKRPSREERNEAALRMIDWKRPSRIRAKNWPGYALVRFDPLAEKPTMTVLVYRCDETTGDRPKVVTAFVRSIKRTHDQWFPILAVQQFLNGLGTWIGSHVEGAMLGQQPIDWSPQG